MQHAANGGLVQIHLPFNRSNFICQLRTAGGRFNSTECIYYPSPFFREYEPELVACCQNTGTTMTIYMCSGTQIKTYKNMTMQVSEIKTTPPDFATKKSWASSIKILSLFLLLVWNKSSCFIV